MGPLAPVPQPARHAHRVDARARGELVDGQPGQRRVAAPLALARHQEVEIEGVQHEFATVEGVREDVTDIVLNLKGVVAQQLIPTPDGKGRKVAMEILLGTPLVQDYIRDGEVHKLKEVMKESVQLGMKTFDQSLFELYQAGEISYEDALRHADSTNEVRLRIKLAQGGDAHTLSQGMDGIELTEVR